jgi:hypothetical protein
VFGGLAVLWHNAPVLQGYVKIHAIKALLVAGLKIYTGEYSRRAGQDGIAACHLAGHSIKRKFIDRAARNHALRERAPCGFRKYRLFTLTFQTGPAAR